MKHSYPFFIACIASLFSLMNHSQAQTAGTLTFSVTTTEPSGGYTGAHCLAIWIEDASGTFIKTKMRYAQVRVSYLNVWINKSAQNVTDAITGATLNSHGTRTITWNATNVSATIVPDGTYKIWLQMADRNQNGPTASITFTKGPAAITSQTFPNSGNFTNMTLTWIPTGSGTGTITEVSNLSLYPNPFNENLYLNYSLHDMQRVSATVYDLEGREIKCITDEMMAEGSHTLTWDATNSSNTKVQSGIYFIRFNCGTKSVIKKAIFRN